MRRFAALALTLTLSLSAHDVLRAQPKGSTPAYRVIVHPANPTVGVARKFLEDALLKKTTGWPSGVVIRPVDQTASSPVRRTFTDEVLHRTVPEVKSYWQQAIFAGRDVPPPELASDDDVVKFVLKYSGAVGYVSGGTNLNGAKVVTIQ
jgi:hypothetical protein